MQPSDSGRLDPAPTQDEAETIIADTVALGIARFNAGQFADAQALFEAVLQLRPLHVEANHHCGLLQMQAGALETALAFLTRALEAEPGRGESWIAVADCLLRLAHYTEARQLLETAQAAGLDDPRTPALLEAARAGQDRTATAEDPLVAHLRDLARKSVRRVALRRKTHPTASPELHAPLAARDWPALADIALRSLARHPELGKDWDLLGVALLQQGRHEAARISLVRASEILPRDPETWDHLGICERLSGELAAAEKCFARSLALEPKRPETWVNLGNLQMEQAKDAKALGSFQQALALQPDCAEAIGNLGNVLRKLGRLDEAVEHCLRARALMPNQAEVHCNLGNVQRDLRQFDAAIESYQRALALDPALAEAFSGLGRTFVDRGRLDEALVSYEQAVRLRPELLEIHGNLLNTMTHAGSVSPAQALEAARRFGLQAARRARGAFTDWAAPGSDGLLRVGIVSGDLRQHPVGFFLEGMLAHLPPDRMELHAYSSFDQEDAVSARLRPHFKTWTSLQAMDNESAARRIHADRIHVLLDLSGHTAHSRLPLFAWRPAPVQASWLGYFATTGLAEMDYLLADPHVVPEGEEAHFTEKIWRLPETYLCFTPPAEAPDVRPLPALHEGRVTFGSFNNLIKLNDRVAALWARILHAVPGSRLFLKTALLDDPTNRDGTLRRFERLGIDPARLIVEGRAPRAELLACYDRVDIALDPFPYPGGTTSVEALWMGVPVITRRGDRFLSHVGETIAQNAGLADWIAADDDAYLAIATARSQDLAALSALRQGLRQQVLASPLFDAARFGKHFTAAIHGMWHDKFGRSGGLA